MPDRTPPSGPFGGAALGGAIGGGTTGDTAGLSGMRRGLAGVGAHGATPWRPAQPSWDEEDEAAERAFKRLTREEAEALRFRNPPVSPWRVIVVQAVVGLVVALLGGLAAGRTDVMWSALYGAATAVVPGALMARGVTSRLSRLTPGAAALSVMVWELMKIVVSAGMLLSAPRFVDPLNWPALLATLAACISVYGFALTWRGPAAAAHPPAATPRNP